MRIIFHGDNAASFSRGFADLVGPDAEIGILPDGLDATADRKAYAAAQAIIGVKFDAGLPMPRDLLLFHVPGAGYDAVDVALLPPQAHLCNCFGHEQAISEYVMGALLARAIPLTDADARLRQGDWAYWAGSPDRVHGEIAGQTVGLLGFGHIGKAIARRAKAFEMTVHVANRSPVATSDLVDRAFGLDELEAFCGSVDALVVSVPLTTDTTGLVGRAALGAMKPDAVILNVGRGPTIDEAALFEALRDRRIGGAVIDTWYRYPSAGEPNILPSKLPFHELSNVLMTPHMSGWTSGTIRRRQQTMADNIRRCLSGAALTNVVRQGRA
ncbi:MAG: 2-hydroxyacid dehydrogenase [Bosea sp. (in: a-proteobacteria)]|uniref:2-hydroxyacid dehydrogenase n=1 Tax=Bosea sp. (in: a-proteobacteria) TaxID=1871050 RepID=UPI0027328027|nr:2-hydroxyacid dehydrogenase [Bosea sp. (in: a-proteobacteria)]MDP3258738.1 2-hydroxyacid dehydrogenase [Bosea sp. (in: a-proteobacteria)]MDP3320841.1 2-hydroxyacid dehydrogenase [Bosea sp. (in: a-proteobacteria)]